MYEHSKYLTNVATLKYVKSTLKLKIIYLKKLRTNSFSKIPCTVQFRILSLSPYKPRQTYLLHGEKLIGLQLVKQFPAFYGSRRFISARHLSLS
jgi:hypothetical protein